MRGAINAFTILTGRVERKKPLKNVGVDGSVL
jgi:hypothetical protein